MSQPEYIVIVCRAWMNEGGFGFNYSWDLRRFSARTVAIKHGFEAVGCDDFNIGTLRGKTLVAFGWMDRDYENEENDLSEIAQPLGLTIGAKS